MHLRSFPAELYNLVAYYSGETYWRDTGYSLMKKWVRVL